MYGYIDLLFYSFSMHIYPLKIVKYVNILTKINQKIVVTVIMINEMFIYLFII